MKINFDAILTDLKGEPVKNDDGKKDLILQVVTETALLAVFADEAQDMRGSDKVDLFKLACKCTGLVDLKVEEVAKIKDRIGRAFGPLIVGRAYELLDPPAAPAKAPAKKEAA